jgi:hypothetical protein
MYGNVHVLILVFSHNILKVKFALGQAIKVQRGSRGLCTWETVCVEFAMKAKQDLLCLRHKQVKCIKSPLSEQCLSKQCFLRSRWFRRLRF